MLTTDFIKECLDVLDLKYSEWENGSLAVSFGADELFRYGIVTVISLRDNMLAFHSRAIGYHPAGDLFAMANRHNCRTYAPVCHIDSENEVVMEYGYLIEHEVSPHYVLEEVIRPSIFRPIHSFAAFELSDEELAKRLS